MSSRDRCGISCQGLAGLSVVPGESALRVDSGQIAFAGRAANTGYHIGGARERVGAIRRVGGGAVGPTAPLAALAGRRQTYCLAGPVDIWEHPTAAARRMAAR